MTDHPHHDELADAIRASNDAIAQLRLAIERADVAQQRDLLAIERRLGAIEDALSGWAADYWQHTEHPPRAS